MPLEDPEGALRLLAELRRLNPEDAGLHLAAAREALALTMMSADRSAGLAYASLAIEAARAAVALDSTQADAHFWLAASLGLQADQVSGKAKITLAQEAYGAVRKALELDPLHGGAHHVLGRIHTGAMRLSWVTRLVARKLGLGAILEQASWKEGERHLRMAVDLDPDPLVHHVELAKLYLQRGPRERGLAMLEWVASRTARHRLDAHSIAEARYLLRKVREH